jgi:hypothetical protein
VENSSYSFLKIQDAQCFSDCEKKFEKFKESKEFEERSQELGSETANGRSGDTAKE